MDEEKRLEFYGQELEKALDKSAHILIFRLHPSPHTVALRLMGEVIEVNIADEELDGEFSSGTMEELEGEFDISNAQMDETEEGSGVVVFNAGEEDVPDIIDHIASEIYGIDVEGEDYVPRAAMIRD